MSEEDIHQFGTPSRWFASTPSQPPADPSKCTKCGKDLEIMGLRQPYPPKRDDMGRAICPHCTTVQPGGTGPASGLGGFAMSDSVLTQQGGNARWMTAEEIIQANIDRLTGPLPGSWKGLFGRFEDD
jgi:hypothetical protein